jgi:hypothetical protein
VNFLCNLREIGKLFLLARLKLALFVREYSRVSLIIHPRHNFHDKAMSCLGSGYIKTLICLLCEEELPAVSTRKVETKCFHNRTALARQSPQLAHRTDANTSKIAAAR